jgi:uncharacterized protein YdeI (YjbR/CyaY-like superfamily)
LRQYRIEKGQKPHTDMLEAYVLEAIENEKLGLRIKHQQFTRYKISSFFKIHLDQNTVLSSALFQLSPGKQKEYAQYIDEAKQEKAEPA